MKITSFDRNTLHAKTPNFDVFQKIQKNVDNYPISDLHAKFWGPRVKIEFFRAKKLIWGFQKILDISDLNFCNFFSFSISSIRFCARDLIFVLTDAQNKYFDSYRGGISILTRLKILPSGLPRFRPIF